MSNCSIARESSNYDLTERLRKASGAVACKNKAVSFFYLLMRNKLAAGEVQAILSEVISDDAVMKETHDDIVFTNGYLADYAKFIVKELFED